MDKIQIQEATAQDLQWAIPNDDDFKLITDAYLDYFTNGSACAPEHTPESLAQEAGFKYGDMGTALKFMIIAAMLGWRELIVKLKPICVKVGWAAEDLRATIQEIKTVASSLEPLYDKYCLPVLDTISAGSAGQTVAQPAPAPATGFNIKILAQPSATFCRIVAYDPTYGTPGARRHLYLTKKSGNSYRVSLGGATVTSWYNEPFFDSVKQAEDFIRKSKGVNTSKDLTGFRFCITDKAVAQGTTPIISDLSNCVLITSDCGPAYIHTNNQYCVESLREEVVEEDIEKHEDLNAALFNNDAKLKPEVKNKINEIVAEFLKDFDEVGVRLDVQDVILTGSNASYNYTKDSDLDIHIVADTSKIEDTVDLHKVIYDAYKSSFNKKFDIELNKVPVELYVETQETPLVSNGIYSVLNDTWVKEPTKESIPEVDQDAIDKAFKPWEKRYKALIADTTDDVEDESAIDKFIDALYELRGKGLSTDGEYSIENLVFKEMRNKGYLDNLKELRHVVIARRLSLHENLNSLTDYLNFLDSLI